MTIIGVIFAASRLNKPLYIHIIYACFMYLSIGVECVAV